MTIFLSALLSIEAITKVVLIVLGLRAEGSSCMHSFDELKWFSSCDCSENRRTSIKSHDVRRCILCASVHIYT